jgi:hypothetical protein
VAVSMWTMSRTETAMFIGAVLLLVLALVG